MNIYFYIFTEKVHQYDASVSYTHLDVYKRQVLSGLRAKRGKEAEIPINSLPFKAGKGVNNDDCLLYTSALSCLSMSRKSP